MNHGQLLSCTSHYTLKGEATMGIAWRTDIEKALDDARAQGRHLLLDFSAAPM
jgi:hypothetical protein